MSNAAKNFRSDIQTFLREEGFMPSINDESLCFKKEGVGYWIDVIGDKPFYVVFHREPISTEGASTEDILKSINDVNTNIRAIKCCLIENYVSLGIESYCHVSEEFKYVFYPYLSILELSDGLVKEAYEKYSSSVESSSSSVSSSDEADLTPNGPSQKISRDPVQELSPGVAIAADTVYINGPVVETKYHKWWATSIELTPRATVINKMVVPKKKDTQVWGDRNEYIEDCDTGKKYYIRACSLGLEPDATPLISKEGRPFTEVYPALPSSVRRINIWSGSGYFAKNLRIR